jgi:hypothetical protein
MQDTGQGYPQHYFQPHQAINTMKPSQAADMAAGRCINATKEELMVLYDSYFFLTISSLFSSTQTLKKR